jgi:DtxR family Mn-dependent transcriptional regulator
MLKALADSRLADYESYAGVRLTPAGRQLAAHVVRRHRLVELFLVEVMGFDWSEVHVEAERLEHAVSERVIERIDEMLGRPGVDPHGHPIPSAEGKLDAAHLPTLDALEPGQRARVARVADRDPEFLKLAERLGLRPGARVRVAARDAAADLLELDLGRGKRVTLGRRAAARISVEAG